MIPDMPDRVSDSGPDSHGPADVMDCVDWLDDAREEITHAARAGAGADRYEAIARARNALANAAKLAEHGILWRWQAVGRDSITPSEVAPAEDYQRDLARDMRALGWRMIDGQYHRPGEPVWRKP